MYITKQISDKHFAQRAKWIAIGFALIAAIIFGRVFWLQVLEQKTLQAKAERQIKKRQSIKLRRGLIHDQTGKLLAVSLPMRSVYAVPTEIKHAVETAVLLAETLHLDADKLIAKLSSGGNFTWIKRNLTPIQAQEINDLGIKGIRFLKEYQRYYPFQRHASHLIGFSGTDSKGLEGLEYKFNSHLMDASQSHESWLPFLDLPKTNHLSGGSLQLTIDSRLQHFVEEELQKAIAAMKAKFGVAILMESQTGRILSMATNPDYDPNKFNNFSQETYYNRAIGHSFEPGSTFKVITLSAAMDAGVIQQGDLFNCENGEYTIGDRTIHDVQNHGFLSLEQILQYSSNICAAKIGMSMPKEVFYQKIQDFGFGSKTGIALSGEAKGTLHHPKNWSDITVATLSYGHAISATPIQVLTAINSLATGGVLKQPVIIDNLLDPQGNPIAQKPQTSRRVLKPEVAKQITEYMKTVTQGRGTGRKASIAGLSIAGKTGTSKKFDPSTGEYTSRLYTSSFVGFFPADDPKLTLFVMIDEPSENYLNSKSAAIVFKEIAQKVLHFYPLKKSGAVNTLPSPFANQAEKENREVADNSTLTLDTRPFAKIVKGKSLREALQLASQYGKTLSFTGSGLITGIHKDKNQQNHYHITLQRL